MKFHRAEDVQPLVDLLEAIRSQMCWERDRDQLTMGMADLHTSITKALSAFQAVKPVEIGEEFDEHDSYYRLGYDSEHEPMVDKIIEGARGEHGQIMKKLRGEG